MNRPRANSTEKIRTVLYGGSFNPLHEGHLALARFVLQQNLAEEVWFVVSPKNPLKEQANPLDAGFRLEILQNQLAEYPHCIASDLEFHLPVPSYTVDTIRYAFSRYPDRHFILLIGGDNLDLFTQWKEYEWLLQNIDILVYPRPGATNLIPENWNRVTLLNAPLMKVSSTEIRNRKS